MAAKRQQSTDSRAAIIKAAFDLFHRQGVNATSVDEILKVSGTGKGQFYHYFSSKDELIHAVVLHVHAMLREKKMPAQRDLRSWEDLEAWFGFFIGFQQSVDCTRGCPMATIGYELTDEHELIRQDINLVFELSRAPLVQFFVRMQAQGELPDDQVPDELADFCYMIMQGGLMISKIRKNTDGFANSVRHCIDYLRSIRSLPV